MNNFPELEKKIKSSPYWREDFELHLEKVEDGLPVYRVQAPSWDEETIKAVAALNMELRDSAQVKS